jgi:hypothetical protein
MSPRFNFSYCRFPASSSEAFPRRVSVLRPVIPIILINKQDHQKKVSYLSLIDSGADLCIFNADIGEIIGLDIHAGKREILYGIALHPITAYCHDILISLGGYEFDCYAGFSEELSHLSYGILGQTGFFDRYKITLDYKSGRIEFNTS